MSYTLPTADALRTAGVDEGIDLLFDAVDDALHAGHPGPWKDLEAWSKEMRPSELGTQNIVAWLVITLPVADQPWRHDWYVAALVEVVLNEPPEKVAAIMDGLDKKPDLSWIFGRKPCI